MKRPSLSIGIEEEYQTIDPETRDLRSHIQMEILSKAKLKIAEQVKPEMHQAVVEVGTKVCRDIKEAREDMRNLRREMITLAAENGLLLGAASTHPFCRLEGAGDLSRRALSPGGGRHAAGGARQPGVRAARSRRHRRPRYRDSHHEFDAVLPAAHPGAVDQFAVLDGHGDRVQVVSLQSF